jgi:hypothetical protein
VRTPEGTGESGGRAPVKGADPSWAARNLLSLRPVTNDAGREPSMEMTYTCSSAVRSGTTAAGEMEDNGSHGV